MNDQERRPRRGSDDHAVMVADPKTAHPRRTRIPLDHALPLVVLAILSLIGGWVGVPAAFGGHNEIEHFLDPVFANARPPSSSRNGQEWSGNCSGRISVCVALLGLLRLPPLLEEAGHGGGARHRVKPLTRYRTQVLGRRVLRQPLRHSPADIYAQLPASLRPRHRQRRRRAAGTTTRGLCAGRTPLADQATSAPTRAGSPLARPACWRHDLRPLALDAL